MKKVKYKKLSRGEKFIAIRPKKDCGHGFKSGESIRYIKREKGYKHRDVYSFRSRTGLVQDLDNREFRKVNSKAS